MRGLAPHPSSQYRRAIRALADFLERPSQCLYAATVGPAMIRTEKLGKRFGETWAVRGLTIEVGRGEVFGFLGPNGAGKTTTVRLLASLIGSSEGRAWVEGAEVGV